MNPVRPQAKSEHGDLVFKCQHCASPLIVDAAAAGMTLNCQRCGRPTPVPMTSVPPSSTSPQELPDLQRKLKENESQRTEVTGYINQLSIQLHRWKLRLQTLNERKNELEEELRKAS
jgi:DNA-directed RNA polymerase subunit M/transcription elongation factor TFIIS